MRLFISYHSPDRSIAVALRQAIETGLPGCEIFLDQSNLRFGYNWQPALYATIERSDAFVTIIGSRLGNWQTAEYYAAHDKKVSNPDSLILLPIIIADRSKGPVPNLPGLSQLHWIECAEPTAPDVLATILEALSGKPVPEPPKPWLLVNPYRGLMALEEQDSDFFFGREIETGQTVEAILKYPNKVISLIGNSGVGKSSLVQAGVIASLKRQKLPDGKPWPDKLKDSREWAFLTFRPADEPVKALVSAFINLWFPDPTDPTKYQRIGEWTKRLMADGSLFELLEATRQRYTELNLFAPKRALLYIDQGEELYSRARDAETLRLSHLVAEAARSNDFVLMLSQRSDFYGNFQANRELFDCSVVVDLPPLKPEDLIRVLREPASHLQVKFHPPELPEQLVEASRGQPGALALLADLMIDVWEKMQRRGTDGVIRALEDAQLIDVEKALASRANRFVSEHPDEVPIIQRLFVLRLVKIYEQGTPFRRRVYEKDCKKQEWAVLAAMSASQWRLVVTGNDNNGAFAEVAHDILLSKWPALSDWITRERQFLLWRTDTDREFGRWVKHWLKTKSIPTDEKERHKFNNDVFTNPAIIEGDSELLRGSRLKEASDYLRGRADDIDPHLRLFIERSAKMANAEIEPAKPSAGPAAAQADASPIAMKVFISYSRKDSDWAAEIRSGLQLAGLEPYFDQQDIAAGEDWEARLSRLIESADAVVFILSPDSVQSVRCQWEIDRAHALAKRIIPILVKDVPAPEVPSVLRQLNYVYVDQQRSLVSAIGELTNALRINSTWVREHTSYMQLATRWQERGRPDELLLRGDELEHASSWLQRRPSDMPEPTPLQSGFIAASRDAAVRRETREIAFMTAVKRQTRMAWGLAAVSVIVLLLNVGYAARWVFFN
jgi:hypothetical protein